MRALIRAAALGAALVLAGCGSANRVPVRGVLLKGGAPFTPPEGASNQVVLVAMEVQGDDGKSIGADEPFAAVLNQADGSFEVPGPDGRGIPPGKYRVSVTQKYRNKHTVDKPKKPGTALIDRDTDLLGDRFSSKGSPIVVEVPGSGSLVVDLDRPTCPSRP